jgi:DNA-binding GntR family transcriptional regulator
MAPWGTSANVRNVAALNPYSHVPLFEQLAEILRGQIQSGELRHLDPLPSETSLVQQYEISRDTARRAMEALREEGLVFTVPHRGTFVGPRPELPQVSPTLTRAGYQTTT